MDTRYILPATVAASVHLLALFGFNAPHAAPVVRPPDPAEPRPPIVVNLEDPPERADDPMRVAERPKGTPDALRPEGEEPPAKIADFTEPLPAPHPVAVEVTAKIVPGVWGFTDGTGDAWAARPVVDFSALDNPPRARSQVAPNYPAEARSAGLAGEVDVEFVVEESGRVSGARVVRSTDARFEAATLSAVARWRFEPGKKGGRPVRFRMAAPVVFSLSE